MKKNCLFRTFGLCKNYYVSLLFLLFSSALSAQITGMVWQDLPVNGASSNAYGVYNTNERGVEGVIVTVYPGGASTMTNSDGIYTIAGVTGNVRVEFTWPTKTWLQSSPDAAMQNTSVQFVNAPAAGVNFGLHDPNKYSQDNPQIATTNMIVGDPTVGFIGSIEGVLEFSYNSGANGRDFAVNTNSSATLVEEATDIAISGAPSSIGTLNAEPTIGMSKVINATIADVGCVYGLAHHKESNSLLAASFMKRFAGMPGGGGNTALGTIYAIDRSVNPNAITSFFTAAAGTDAHDYSSTSLGAPGGDGAVMSSVSKSAWADIDLSSDGNTLYAINLADRNIYTIPVNTSGTSLTAGAASTISFPVSVTSGLCSNDEWVPGAIKVHEGEVYVGITCTAETSQQTSDLHFYVYKFTEGTTGPFTQVVDMPIYTRGAGPTLSQDWLPWNSSQAAIDATIIYPQPWLIDVEFDEFGKIYLGLRNRTGDMRASFNPAIQYCYEFGDVVVGTPTGATYSILETVNAPGYEYLDDDTAAGSDHTENVMGSLLVLPGSVEVLTNANIGNLIQGIRTFSSVDATTVTPKVGAPVRYYGINQAARPPVIIGNPFGKVSGIGDLELMTAPAPVEIGNLVWLDTDADGVQDAGEAGIQGVEVQLLDAGGTLIETATTDLNGNYIFSNGGNAASSTASHIYGLTALNPNTAYTVRIANITGASQQTPLAMPAVLTLTSANTGEGANMDINDSDGVASGSNANAAVQALDIPMSGANNHTFDFGFSPPPPCPAPRCGTVTVTQN